MFKSIKEIQAEEVAKSQKAADKMDAFIESLNDDNKKKHDNRTNKWDAMAQMHKEIRAEQKERDAGLISFGLIFMFIIGFSVLCAVVTNIG